MTAGNDNRSGNNHTITIERWSEAGDLHGAYLVSLLVSGQPQPFDARICETRDEAYDFAKGLLNSYPSAAFHDQSESGE